MARVISIIIGVIVVSMIITFMFKFGHEVGQSANSETASQLATLSSNYEHKIQEANDSQSVLSRLRNVTSGSVVEQGLFFVDSGITGGKVLLDSVDNTHDLINTIEDDTGLFAESKFMIDGILSIIGLIFVVSILYFFWRGKAET